MKRELKLVSVVFVLVVYVPHCKAYPDEKGIETIILAKVA